MKYNALYPELIVLHLERSLGFYVDVLGFRCEYDRPEEKFAFLSLDEAQIMLLQDNENQHSRTGNLEYPRGQGVNFSISCKAVAPIADSLKKSGHSLRIPIREQWHRVGDISKGERQLWVMDPDGYLLRFIEDLGMSSPK
jgi:lactoylglutathione lyase